MTPDDRRIRTLTRFVIVCWGGVICGAMLTGIALLYGNFEIPASDWPQLVGILFLVLWYGTVVLTLWWQMIEAWRWWCLLILAPWIWPPLGAATLLLAPIAFLCFVTARIINLRRLGERAV